MVCVCVYAVRCISPSRAVPCSIGDIVFADNLRPTTAAVQPTTQRVKITDMIQRVTQRERETFIKTDMLFADSKRDTMTL